MRVARFEIQSFVGDRAEITKRWMSASDRLREAHNYFWRTWLVWHTQNDSPRLLREWLSELRCWHDRRKSREQTVRDLRKKKLPVGDLDPLPDKPKIPVEAIPKVLQQALYNGLIENFPELHGRPLELLRNCMTRDVIKHKAATGDLSGWIAALLDRQAIPSMTHPAPIRFDKTNSKIIVPEELGPDGKLQPCRIQVRFNRISDGASKSWLDVAVLNSTSRKTAGQRAILRAIVAGEYDFCGSTVQYHKRQGKWFAYICWDRKGPIAEATDVDRSGTAVVSARRGSALAIALPSGRRIRVSLGSPHYHPVGAVRRNLLTQRWSRQANYRVAGSANKGHGRNRALEPLNQYSSKWKHFVLSFNHTLTTRVVRILAEHRVARLVYMQPSEEYRESRFLNKSGKIPGRHDSTGWDWNQIATMFGYKCEQYGIHLEVRKVGERRARRSPSKVEKIGTARKRARKTVTNK